MAGVEAIRDVGDSLVAILRQAVDPALILPSRVHLAMPRDYEALDTANELAISVFLYHTAIVAEQRNLPRRIQPDGRTTLVLPLELGFLITPWARDAGNALLLAGMVARAFHDHAQLSAAQLVGGPWRTDDSVQVMLESLPVEDHYRIWETTRVPYRLSLTYKARVIGIDAAPHREGPPVVDGRFDVGKRP